MADNVAVIESEYNRLENSLGNSHEDCMEQLGAIIEALQGLNGKGGGLYTEHLTPKVNALIDEIKSVKNRIQDVFTTSEELVKNFQQVVDDYDTLC